MPHSSRPRPQPATTRTDTDTITDALIATVGERLAANRQVRRTLPASGRLHIDRQIPFLCVYRLPPGRADEGTRRLVEGEASYLVASGERAHQRGLSALVTQVVRTLSHEFGAFLIVEIWSAPQLLPDTPEHGDDELPAPCFHIVASARSAPALDPTLARLESSLGKIRLFQQRARVEVQASDRVTPPNLPPLVSARDARTYNCWHIGLAVAPVYRDAHTHTLYPIALQTLHRGTTRALKQAFFEFVRTRTSHHTEHYHALGRKAMVKAVWEVDHRLAEVSESFDFLLQVTPINAASAWSAFRRSQFNTPPTFSYRPLPVDPARLKRMLYNIPIERVEDLTLAQLFQEKQRELDQQLSMLLDRGTSRFLYDSMLLFGNVDQRLLQVAEHILHRLSPRSRDDPQGGSLDAHAFAARATDEIHYYKQSYPSLSASVHVRNDIATGLMVSKGNLLIGKDTRVPASRVDALLHHEVGTHIVTYFNGRAQPFRQLHAGLAGYEELQEGLAVLAEYLGGNLSRPRLRLLAARVVAAHCLIDGASFVETFRVLTDTYQFGKPTAFTITMRIYRGGGLTKDAVYLRGLLGVLDYIQNGGTLTPLFVGKIAAAHIPIVRELQLRGVLQPAPLQPRYMETEQASKRFERLRQGASVLELVERR